eukprot:5143733-Prymnesium_polylepis.2
MCAFAACNTVEKSCCIPPLQPLYNPSTSALPCYARVEELCSYTVYSSSALYSIQPLHHPSVAEALLPTVDADAVVAPDISAASSGHRSVLAVLVGQSVFLPSEANWASPFSKLRLRRNVASQTCNQVLRIVVSNPILNPEGGCLEDQASGAP